MKRKIIDEKGRFFGLISIIDIIVIIAVIALLACFFFKFNVVNTQNGSNGSLSEITYVVKIHGISESSINAYQKGDKLYCADISTQSCLGEIVDTRYEQATEPIQKVDGIISTGTIEDKYDMYITLKANAMMHNGSWLIENIFSLNENDTYQMYTKYATFTGSIESISDNG